MPAHNKRQKLRAGAPEGRDRFGMGTVSGIPWVYLVIPALTAVGVIVLVVFWLKDGSQ